MLQLSHFKISVAQIPKSYMLWTKNENISGKILQRLHASSLKKSGGTKFEKLHTLNQRNLNLRGKIFQKLHALSLKTKNQSEILYKVTCS